MTSRPLPRLIVASLFLLLLGACDLTVRIGTSINDDGSGEFTLAIEMDRELVEALEGVDDAAEGLSSLEQLFTGLAAAGWVTSRSEPGGGLLFRAQRPFDDSADFDRALRELAGAGTGDDQPLDLGTNLLIDYQVDDSFLRTGASVSGSIDLTFGDDPNPLLVQLQDLLRQRVHIEVAAELPGSISTQQGGGTVSDGAVVWRPVIGERTTFGATSSKVKSSVLLAIVLPGLALLAIAGWVLMGRGRERGSDDDVVMLEPIAVADEADQPTF